MSKKTAIIFDKFSLFKKNPNQKSSTKTITIKIWLLTNLETFYVSMLLFQF